VVKEDFREMWDEFFSDVGGEVPDAAGRLVHYTRTNVIEEIIKNNEFWLSHPLLMNDYQEVREGINIAIQELHAGDDLWSGGKVMDWREKFYDEVLKVLNDYGNDHGYDLYIGCFSYHTITECQDGLLPMWRGYGDNGGGAALVLDLNKAPLLESSPLRIDKVNYRTDEERRTFAREKIRHIVELLSREVVSVSDIGKVALIFFNRILYDALFSKHKGFESEQEWRLVYNRGWDYANKAASMLSYFHGPQGLEPKLKLKLAGGAPWFHEDFNFDDIIDSILIGPRASTPLSLFAAQRMVDTIDKPHLKNRIRASTIPFRG
tara:strand:- start:28 stop:987 length:960 start_codon:yes stop_codon:yes gene_type:complete